jgi:hypothetical protein
MLLTGAAACAEDDRVGPSPEIEKVGAPDFALGTQPGIVFASAGLTVSQVNSVHTGMLVTVTPSNILPILSKLREKRGRIIIKLAGHEDTFKNPGGSFNLTKWKAGVDRFRNIDFSSYIADGTIVGHYLIDEPMFASRWGGQVIPQSTVEEAARHSKWRWKNMLTIVAAPPEWLANTTMSYTNLDAGWSMYRSKNGSVSTWITRQINKAKEKKLGMVAGLNVLDGGNGSSGVLGTQAKTWTMSASELNQYGSALLSQSFVCGFAMWMYKDTYYNRADVKTVMGSLSEKARLHAKTPCTL